MKNNSSFGEKAFAASQFSKERQYWLSQLSGNPAKCGFHFDNYKNRGEAAGKRDSHRFDITGELYQKISKLSLGSDQALFLILTAVIVLLLDKHNGRGDILVGTTIYKQEIEGDFVNTILTLRNEIHTGMTFKELLLQVKETAAGANENQNYPVEMLLFQLGLDFSEDDFPLFDVVVLLENIQDRSYLRNIRPNVLFTFKRGESHIAGILEYNTAIYEKKDIEIIAGHLLHVLEQVLFEVDLPLSGTGILTKKEREQVLYEFNDTTEEYPADKTLHHLFVEQVGKSPDAVAVVGPSSRAGIENKTSNDFTCSLTYRALERKTGDFAASLAKKGVGENTIVAIMAARSVETVIGLLAILKAGGAYLPISPEYPEERIEYILADSGAEILLNEDFCKKAEIPSPGGVAEGRGGSEIAYVIYTSGTTGSPKGVLIEQRSAVNVVTWFGRQYGLQTGVRVLQMSDYIFDASVNQVFGSLLHGSTLYIIEQNLLTDMTALRRYIEEKSINLINFVPLLLKELLCDGRKLESLKIVISGAERLDDSIKDKILEKGYILYNHYGPTEATIDALALRCSEDEVNLGKPIANARCYIVDKNNLPLPIGVPGELVVAGAGVSRGYLNRPELTTEKFPAARGAIEGPSGHLGAAHQLNVTCVDDFPKQKFCSNFFKTPLRGEAFSRFAAHSQKTIAPLAAGGKIYKTGDLTRWRADGTIDFLGRIDNQVKIRGYRIELEEIEKRLIRHDSIKEAVVTARENNSGEKYLCAYIVKNPDPCFSPSMHPESGVEERPVIDLDTGELRLFLSRNLPDYMLPAHFVRLEKLPLTNTGKVDRHSLPDPDFQAGLKDYIPPANRVEEQLVEVWQHVLGVERIGTADNFFQAGGDSIKAIQATARLKKYHLGLKINDLFLQPTIKELVRHECVVAVEEEIDQGIVSGSVELTPIQSYFFESHSGYLHHYNQSVMLYREEGFNADFVNEVLAKLVGHHDALRMVFEEKDGEVVQMNRDNKDKCFDFKVLDFTGRQDIENRIKAEADALQASMDLKNSLLKGTIFRTSGGDHLLLVIHHLVVDGISWRILLEDLHTAYGQLSRGEDIRLPDKTTSFKYWSAKLREYAAGSKSTTAKVLQGELTYWQGIDNLKIEPLPRDFEIGSEKKKVKFREIVSTELDEEQTRTLLKKVNWAYNTEINDILLCALGRSVREWTGNEKVSIYLEGHGRESIIEGVDISRTVGWFTTRYPVILNMSKTDDISYNLRQIKETLRRIPNKGIGCGILKYLAPGKGKENFPVNHEPEITFNYLGQFGDEGSTQSERNSTFFSFSNMSTGQERSLEHALLSTLDIGGISVDGKLNVSFSYNRYEYKRKSIEKLAGLYKTNLLKIISHCTSCKRQVFTPGDFGYPHISIEDLENIVRHLEDNVGRDMKIRSLYPLSPMQKGMLFHSLRNRDSNAYFEQGIFTLKGHIDKDLLENSFNILIERYDILRTDFIYEGLNEPLQVVLENRRLQINFANISSLNKYEKEKYLDHLKEKDKGLGFDLSKDLLIRVSLINVGAGIFKLMWSFHHILMDGWCMGIIYKEMMQIYGSLSRKRPLQLADVTPYESYIRWLQKQDKEIALEYWRHYLSGYDQQAVLPRSSQKKSSHENKIAANNSIDEEYEIENYQLIIDEELSGKLEKLGKQNSITLNTLFQTLWGILLQKYNNTDDVVFGAVVSGRPAELEGIEDMVGLFINTIPVRVISRKGDDFSALAKKVQEEFVTSKTFEYLTLAEIQSRSELNRNLIDHIMIFENYPIQEIVADESGESEPEFKFERLEMVEQTNYGFNIVVSPGSSIHIVFSYNSLSYTQDVINKLAIHFKKIITLVAGTPKVSLNKIEMVTEEEKRRILNDFNDTHKIFSSGKTIDRLFEEQVEKHPDAAVLVENALLGTVNDSINRDYHTITYGEFDKRAAEAVRLLHDKGVRRGMGVIVAVMIGQSIEMCAAILGILKAGGAYLPIDTDYPGDRIDYMLADSAAKLMITTPALSKTIKRSPIDIICPGYNVEVRRDVTGEFPSLGGVAEGRGGLEAKSCAGADLAYVIYTSGSTGKPKGVFVEHRGAVNTLECRKEEYGLNSSHISLQLFSSAFDGFVTSFFTPVISGARIVLLNEKGVNDLNRIRDAVVKQKVTHFISIPVLFQGIIEYLTKGETATLEAVTLAGESLVPHVIEAAKEKNENIKIFNEYGVTEGSVMSTLYRGQEKNSQISIGKPVWNTKIYILDKQGCLQPTGLWGEMCIAGAGLARGYLNRPELTIEKFASGGQLFEKSRSKTFDGVPRSGGVGPSPTSHNQLIYKTGDLARWLPDGNIEFSGRIDNQVKIRGFRIELGEIENRLLSNPDIKEAAVTVRESNLGEKYLCAYIVKNPDPCVAPSMHPETDVEEQSTVPIDTAELRLFLSHTLPGYMVPAHYVFLDKLPLTPNGKVDRKSLPEPERSVGIDRYVPPRDKIEVRLAEVWQEVLGIEKIGIADHFFDVGGDSIKAIRIAARLKRYHLDLKINDLLLHPTIIELRNHDCIKQVSREIEQGAVSGKVELTPIQVWFFKNNFSDPHHFIQSVMLYNEQGFNASLLEKVFTKMTEHHDALRMVYRKNDDCVIQENRDNGARCFDLRIFDFTGRSQVEKKVEKEAGILKKSIDLEKGPLLKAALFKTSMGDHLLIIAHHLVVDGISWRIILEDLENLYEQLDRGEELRLPAKTDSFKYWAEKLRGFVGGSEGGETNAIAKEMYYWQELDKTPVKPLPRDFEIGQKQRKLKNMDSAGIELGSEETEKLLKKVNRPYNTEINDILLCALGLALHEWSGREQFAVNLEGHGRESIVEDVDISRTAGWFTSQYPLLLDMSRAGDISYDIPFVKEILRRIPNKGIGYGILRYLVPMLREGSYSFKIEPEISFNYLGQFGNEDGKRSQDTNRFFRFSSLEFERDRSTEFEQTHALNISGIVIDSQCRLSISYNKYEFKRKSIEKLAAFYRENLVKIIEHCVTRQERTATPTDLGCPQLSIENLRHLSRYVGDNIGEETAIQAIYPLNPMQKGMFYHAVKARKSHAYFQQNVFSITGKIDKSVFEKAFNKMIERYDVLRTVFLHENLVEPLQIVLKTRRIGLYYESIEHLSEAGKSKHIEDFVIKEKERGFDLSKDLLMAISLFKMNSGNYKLVWNFHHILMDGWCVAIIYRELIHIYCSLMQEKTIELEKVTPYKSYISWLQEQDMETGLRFWREYLTGYEEQANLPAFHSLDHVTEYEPGKYRLNLEESLISGLNQVARRNQVTLNTIFQTLWGILLQKYNNTNDVVFGAVVSGRSAEIEGIEDMIGLFINTIPVRIKSAAGEKFSKLLSRVQAESISLKSYEYLPLADIQSNSVLKSHLIHHLFAFENYPIQEVLGDKDSQDEPGFKVESLDVQEQTNYDFYITVIPGKTINLNFSYNVLLYEADLIKHLALHLKHVIKQVVNDDDIAIDKIGIVTENEKQSILYDFNDTGAEYPKDKTIHRLFEEQVEKTPDNIAVMGESLRIAGKHNDNYPTDPACREVTLTYRELNQEADKLAGTLRQKGVNTDVIVAVMSGRKVETVMAMFAVLKAGGAYLPVETDYPGDRIKFMLADSNTKILVTGSEVFEEIESIQQWQGDTIFLERIAPAAHDAAKGYSSQKRPSQKNKILAHITAPRTAGLAYIIYTSGTTGNPKGVMIEHGNLVRLLFTDKFQFDFSEQDVWTMFHSYCFDFSVWEMYGALLYGGKLLIIPAMTARDTQRYLHVLKREKVTVLNQTPSAFYNLSNLELESPAGELKIRNVIFGGEALSIGRLRDWKTRYPAAKLINMYGITETTVHVTFKEIRDEDIAAGISNIGKPIPTLTNYIFDAHLQLLPCGVAGELVVGGKGLGRGYLNRPGLTKEKFIEHPYIANERLYRSGDLSRILRTGDFEYLGRIDSQVKIRGYRIELGEIEKRLSSHRDIKETVVTVRENSSGEKYLCAYIVQNQEQGEQEGDERARPGVIADAAELRLFLSRTLPDYMMPSYFVTLENIPLNANGKIDRKALPEPGKSTGQTFIAPRDKLESRLANIWAEVLSINVNEERGGTIGKQSAVGIDENFFELGGHSLKAVGLTSRIHKEFKLKIPLTVLFERPTIRKAAEYIRQAGETKYSDLRSVEKREYYDLSSAQKRIYILQQIETGNTVYNLPATVVLKGKIDKERLENTFYKLIGRHESLRTSFMSAANEPVQKIHRHKDIRFKIEYYNVGERRTVPGDREDEIVDRFIRPFDLSQAPLLRVGLVESAEQEHILLVDMHHIITDGASQSILTGEFMSLYAGSQLPPARLRYRDYSKWQNNNNNAFNLKEQAEFWLRHFARNIPLLDLPTDYARPVIQSFVGKKKSFNTGSKEAAGLKKIALEQECTLFMLLFAIYKVLLFKLSGQDDIVVGTPAAGRSHADSEQIIGMFVNTIGIRSYPGEEMTFAVFLQEEKKTILNAFENQDFQFEDLIEKIEIERDAGRNPLFDVMFALQNLETGEVNIPGLTLSPYKHDSGIAKFDITLQAYEAEDDILFSLEYCTRLFKEATIDSFTCFFNKIVSSVIDDPGKKLRDVEIISEEERKMILFDFNDTATSYPKERTIHSLFEELVDRSPDHVALVGSSLEIADIEAGRNEDNYQNRNSRYALTYRELNKGAGLLARFLNGKGVKPDTIAGLMVDRSLEMMIGIFAILKAGGAYLPIDLDYPVERIKYMLKDSCAKLLLTTPGLYQEDGILKGIDIETIFIKETGKSQEKSVPPDMHPKGQGGAGAQLAYVIYTSGTTGKPKGNLTTHYNAVRVVKNTNYIEIKENDRVLQLSNYAFDGSVFDIYGALLNGSALILANKNEVLSVETLSHLIRDEKITLFFVTTALFNTLIDLDISCLKHVGEILFGGERVSVEHSRKALEYLGPNRVLHVYGPTETTVYASYYAIDTIEENALTIPIGGPIANTTIYILDKNLNPVPIGLKGEMYIGGDGLARGYLNQPELTAERFIYLASGSQLFEKSWTKTFDEDHRPGFPSPGGVAVGRGGLEPTSNFQLIYRTGDLARWIPGGAVEFLGRIDQQVKIRGFRIELGEIENQLLIRDEVKEAVVIDRTSSSGDKYLCAYIVLTDTGKNCETAVLIDELREYLAQDLPDFMIPPFYEILEELPLTANGKVDRRALPEPSSVITSAAYTAPRNKWEKTLTVIWSELLEIEEEKLSIDANFFELGGHSLKATVLISRIHRELNVKIPLVMMFKNPCIRDLGRLVKKAVKEEFTAIAPAEEKEYYILSSAQRRLYVLQQMDVDSTAYNIPLVTKLIGTIDTNKLENIFQGLIQRHESFRTCFIEVNNEPVQKIEHPGAVNFRIENVGARRAVPGAFVTQFIRPFDLSKPALLRAGITRLNDNEYILLVDTHHIISDGVSQSIVIQDFMHLYQGALFPPLRLQYKDYSEWQNGDRQRQAIKQQEKYWLDEFQEDIPVLNLPGDFPRPPVFDFAGDHLSFEIGEEETAAIKEIAAGQGVTQYMVFLSLFDILLWKLSGQDDLVTGTPIATRRHTDLESVVGMFVNTLALRRRIQPENSFREFLNVLKEGTLSAFENQEYQYEDLVNKVYVDKERDVSRNPLFDVSFSLHNVDNSANEIPGLKLFPYEFENKTAKFDLMLNGNEAGDKMGFVFEYRTQLFKKETIARFILYFKKIIRVVTEEPGIKLSGIEIITEAEKELILKKFNDTDTEYPHDKTIHELFEEQAAKTPGNVALVGMTTGSTPGASFLTYDELNQKSDQLALFLYKKGITTDTIAAVILERSIEMIIALFAVIKAGGTYLPISTGSPIERKLFMMQDSHAKVVVTTGDVSKDVVKFEPLQVETVVIEAGIWEEETGKRQEATGSAGLAYVIYTSGSTGDPKGVMIQHRSVVNRLNWMQRLYPIGEQDVILQKTTFVFDVSVWELFWWSFHGASLCLLGVGEEKDPAAMIETIGMIKVTTMHFVPSMLGTFLEYCETVGDLSVLSCLRQVFASGEALMPFHVEKFNELIHPVNGTDLINLYGPTEATVDVSYYNCFPGKQTANVPIGKPIDNIRLYIVNESMALQPPGVVGELCIAGAGLARGYLNRPELTAEKFPAARGAVEGPSGHLVRTSPHMYFEFGVGARRAVPGEVPSYGGVPRSGGVGPSPTSNNQLIYKTGDLARWLRDGNIEFLGRMDYQVKIRGFRIELGEIENELLKHEKIKEAVVLTRDDQMRNKYLSAYIVTKDPGSVEPKVLRQFLSKNLPDYMIPAYFSILKKMPLTPNGKIDRKSLPEPDGENLNTGIEYEPPHNDIEEKLVEVWQEVLNRKPVGINDNFFFMGGDSIKAIQVASRMNRFGYKLEVRDIFKYPRAAELAPRVKDIRSIKNAIDQGPVTGRVPLTPIQHEFFSRPSPRQNHFNQSVMFQSKDRLAEDAVRAIFSKIIEHHDALRMCFPVENGSVVQVNRDTGQSHSLRVVDFCSRRNHDNAAEEMEIAANEIQSSIDLEEGPLMKLGLFRLLNGDRLLIVIHHLAIDGISWRILFEDIALLFEQFNKGEELLLPPKTTSFKSWAERLSLYANENSFLEEKNYWLEFENRAPSIPIIKRDFDTGTNLMKDGRTLSFTISEDETEQLLTKVNRAFGTEINDILLSALGLSIKKSFGHDTLLITLEGHGREHVLKNVDTNRTVGWFTSVYPAVLDVSFQQNLARQIMEIKESLRRIPNKGIGYGILKYLTAKEYKKGLDFNAKPQIIFNYLGQFDADIEKSSFEMAGELKGNSISPAREREYDFDVSGIVSSGKLTISISFSRKQYKEKTVRSLLDHYENELKQVIGFCISREEQELTPSDLTYDKLSIDMLERLKDRYPIEDIYPLSPMQEGMLFHALYDSTSSAFFEQFSFRVSGNFNSALVENSLNELFKRHDILRTLFVHEDLERPQQLLLKEKIVEFYYEDISGKIPGKEKDRFIMEYKMKDRQRSFDLSREVSMRAAMFRVNKEEYEFIWSIHHILLDGWSTMILFSEYFEIYNAFLENRRYRLQQVTPYREYIRWLEDQDKTEGLLFWREYLAGYEQVPSLSKFISNKKSDKYKLETYRVSIGESLTGALEKKAKEYHVTLNVLFQALWAILLQKYNNNNDILYGTVVSGRPPDVPGIEQMIGLFINTVPVRVRIEINQSFPGLLEKMQQDTMKTKQYEYIPLAEVQANSSLKEGTIDHILVFQNFPVGAGGENKSKTPSQDVLSGLTHGEVQIHTNYDFNIMVDPGESLHIRFKYNALLYEHNFVEDAARQIQMLMEQVVNGNLLKLSKVELISTFEKEEMLSQLSMELE